jgi:hypothetical protein
MVDQKEPRDSANAADTTTERNEVQRKPFVFDPDRITKSLALLGLIAYVIGLLVTNTYLLQYSASEFTFLKPKFIYTGLLVLFMMSIPPVIYFYLVKQFTLYGEGNSNIVLLRSFNRFALKNKYKFSWGYGILIYLMFYIGVSQFVSHKIGLGEYIALTLTWAS